MKERTMLLLILLLVNFLMILSIGITFKIVDGVDSEIKDYSSFVIAMPITILGFLDFVGIVWLVTWKEENKLKGEGK